MINDIDFYNIYMRVSLKFPIFLGSSFLYKHLYIVPLLGSIISIKDKDQLLLLVPEALFPITPLVIFPYRHHRGATTVLSIASDP